MNAAILAIATHLPGDPVTNEELAGDYPEWSVSRIAEKTGIHARHLAAPDVCASDLAVLAAQKLFSTGACAPADIDYLLLCTQSPDYLLPATACLLQHRLGLPKQSGALDFNLGCSGYIVGLGLAQGLISTGQAKNILLLTADTYSKYIEPGDRSSATIFGDGATATLIAAQPSGPGVPAHQAAYVYGTDGGGASHLIVRDGAMRSRCAPTPPPGASTHPATLHMNGPEVFSFALKTVPASVRDLLGKTGTRLEDIDLFVFHQANRYMLHHLRLRLGIPEEKFYLHLESCGNTVSGTIPLALEAALAANKLHPGQTVLLAGFGVGLSWATTLLTWPFLGPRQPA